VRPRFMVLLSLFAGLALLGCSGPNRGSWTPVSSSATSREELAQQIRNHMEELVASRNLPYVVTEAEFQDADPSQMASIGKPGGTYWVIQFDDPLKTGAQSGMTMPDLILYEPLRLYRDALAPYMDQLGFVTYYILAYRDSQQSFIEIRPKVLRSYQAGELTNKQMSDAVLLSTTNLPSWESP